MKGQVFLFLLVGLLLGAPVTELWAQAPVRSASPIQTNNKTSVQKKKAIQKSKTKSIKKTDRRAGVRKAAVSSKTRKPTIRKASLKPTQTRSAKNQALLLDEEGNPLLQSSAFYVVNQRTNEVLLERKSAAVLPIASITKLMTAMVVLEAGQNLQENLTISEADVDVLKGTGSRLIVGTGMTREELLLLMLMSSENRAASALARYYPGGTEAFVQAMNAKARLLGMWDTQFEDSSGLNPNNISSPRDLATLVTVAATYPLIRTFSTTIEHQVEIAGRMRRFVNTNGLVRNSDWEIILSKTGYISEAGRCLVMLTQVQQQPVVIVLMDSTGRYTRTADALRVRRWLETIAADRMLLAAGGGVLSGL